ncbi:hypothetical protein P3T36_007873 [Kitasatospora sp. MAP12-15]|nr:hypothetical protein [Kitasatospora sp. MAP12-44]
MPDPLNGLVELVEQWDRHNGRRRTDPGARTVD